MVDLSSSLSANRYKEGNETVQYSAIPQFFQCAFFNLAYPFGCDTKLFTYRYHGKPVFADAIELR